MTGRKSTPATTPGSKTYIGASNVPSPTRDGLHRNIGIGHLVPRPSPPLHRPSFTADGIAKPLMAASSPVHACFRAQCGICGQALVAGVRFLPLISCEIASGSPLCLDGAVFPSGNISTADYHGRSLCWRQKCQQCKGGSRAVGVHLDCFSLFRQECTGENALDRLWFASLSRSPWWFALNARGDGKTDFPLDLVYEKAETIGLPSWKVLPPELTQMIQGLSQSAIFWPHLSALSFIRDLPAGNSPESHCQLSVSLSDVLAWERGSAPILDSDERGLPVLRLTSDSRGLRRVERLESRPCYQDWRSDTMEFVIQDLSLLRHISAEFKYNVMRLDTPDINHGFHIWDMPSPPLLEDCEFAGHIGSSARFSTIDLRVVTGLTFFFSHSKVYAVHGHTPSSPFATSTFEQFSPLRQTNVAWIYIPIPRGDEILSFGVRLKRMFGDGRTVSQMPCFMFRTKLAGEVIVGPAHYRLGWQDVHLAPAHPKLLIHNITDFGPITVFGAYCPTRSDSVVGFSDTPPSIIPARSCLFSAASLESVSAIDIFDNAETGTSMGLIFHYEGGAKRAVGSCRLGLDAARTYQKPSRLCWRSTSEIPPSMRIISTFESGDGSPHKHDDDDWVCMRLEGTVEFWYSQEESAILIHRLCM